MGENHHSTACFVWCHREPSSVAASFAPGTPKTAGIVFRIYGRHVAVDQNDRACLQLLTTLKLQNGMIFRGLAQFASCSVKHSFVHLTDSGNILAGSRAATVTVIISRVTALPR